MLKVVIGVLKVVIGVPTALLLFLPGEKTKKKKKPESALPPLKIEKEAKMTLRQ